MIGSSASGDFFDVNPVFLRLTNWNRRWHAQEDLAGFLLNIFFVYNATDTFPSFPTLIISQFSTKIGGQIGE